MKLRSFNQVNEKIQDENEIILLENMKERFYLFTFQGLWHERNLLLKLKFYLFSMSANKRRKSRITFENYDYNMKNIMKIYCIIIACDLFSLKTFIFTMKSVWKDFI